MTGASVPVHTLLPTTIVGSLPKPSWLAEPEVLWSPWALEGDALDEGKHDALPEQAFYMIGTIDEAVAAAERLAAS